MGHVVESCFDVLSFQDDCFDLLRVFKSELNEYLVGRGVDQAENLVGEHVLAFLHYVVHEHVLAVVSSAGVVLELVEEKLMKLMI